jgi:hypothetical protein
MCSFFWWRYRFDFSALVNLFDLGGRPIGIRFSWRTRPSRFARTACSR